MISLQNLNIGQNKQININVQAIIIDYFLKNDCLHFVPSLILLDLLYIFHRKQPLQLALHTLTLLIFSSQSFLSSLFLLHSRLRLPIYQAYKELCLDKYHIFVIPQKRGLEDF